jgi:CheY-like chemotaxis protein
MTLGPDASRVRAPLKCAKGTTFAPQIGAGDGVGGTLYAPRSVGYQIPRMETHDDSAARVLVIDDESAICRIMTRTLERQGFAASSVSDVGSVATTLSSGEFDVILLDRSMSLTDGKPLLPVVLAHKKQAKVLFFTGELVDKDELEFVDGVVQKPINGSDLAVKLRQVLV